MFFENLCVLVIWMKVASALEGLVFLCFSVSTALVTQREGDCFITAVHPSIKLFPLSKITAMYMSRAINCTASSALFQFYLPRSTYRLGWAGGWDLIGCFLSGIGHISPLTGTSYLSEVIKPMETVGSRRMTVGVISYQLQRL